MSEPKYKQRLPQEEVYHSTYCGVDLYRVSNVALPWQAYTGWTFVRADTLYGLKQLVKEFVN